MRNNNLILREMISCVINGTGKKTLSFNEILELKTIYSYETISKFRYCYKDLSDEKVESVLLKLSELKVSNIFQSINFEALLEGDSFFAFPDNFQYKSDIEEIGKKINELASTRKGFLKSARREAAKPKFFFKTKKHH